MGEIKNQVLINTHLGFGVNCIGFGCARLFSEYKLKLEDRLSAKFPLHPTSSAAFNMSEDDGGVEGLKTGDGRSKKTIRRWVNLSVRYPNPPWGI